MEEELQGTQNEGAEPSADQSQATEKTVGELLAEEEAAQTNEQAESERDGASEEDEKEEKKQRDFEKGMYKFRDLYKQTKAELEEIKGKTVEEVSEEEPDQQKEAIEVLRQIIREEVTPLKEEKVWDEFEKKPYVDVLGKEINEELSRIENSTPKMSLENKLEQARKSAIANNIDTIIKVSKEVGAEDAYKNQTLKKNQAGLGESASKAGREKQSLLEKVKAGTLSDQEWRDNAEEIDKAMREEIGIKYY